MQCVSPIEGLNTMTDNQYIMHPSLRMREIRTGDIVFKRLMLSAFLLLPAIAQAADAQAPVWGYMGGGNDDEGWGTLTPEFALCDLGHNQSPVIIGDTKQSTMQPLIPHYHTTTIQIEKKDRTLVIAMKGAGTLVDEGHSYKLEEMRIHTPAEHEIVGHMYQAELHLIHRDAKGEILIVAIFLKLSEKDNTALQHILDHTPAKANIKTSAVFNPGDVLPEKKGYYAYSGSLSWPPCTEGVQWRVMKESIAISHAQMNRLGTLIGRNARLLQPLYLRTIRETIN